MASDSIGVSRAKLLVKETRQADARGDHETAHMTENRLLWMVAAHAASGHPDAQEIAIIATSLADRDHPRWYA